MKKAVCFSLFLVWCLVLLPQSGRSGQEAKKTTAAAPDTSIVRTLFDGEEQLTYNISWSGGIKIGELRLAIEKQPDQRTGYAIRARVRDWGLFKFFYPVNDTFATFVRSPLMLPYRYEVHQREGRGSETRRLTLYDQEERLVAYHRDDEKAQWFTIDGVVYNEFSSFYITRCLHLNAEEQLVVPTFADKKRHEVPVRVAGRQMSDSLFGKVRTVQVNPKMHFKGLYDKDGDTTFWLTDDTCRIPVRINSKILIGSLTAELVSYTNPGCALYPSLKVEEE